MCRLEPIENPFGPKVLPNDCLLPSTGRLSFAKTVSGSAGESVVLTDSDGSV